jgi:hypothetical protein
MSKGKFPMFWVEREPFEGFIFQASAENTINLFFLNKQNNKRGQFIIRCKAEKCRENIINTLLATLKAVDDGRTKGR